MFKVNFKEAQQLLKDTENYLIYDYKDHKIFIPKQIHTTTTSYGIASYYVTSEGLKISRSEMDLHKSGETNWKHRTLEQYQLDALENIKEEIDEYMGTSLNVKTSLKEAQHNMPQYSADFLKNRLEIYYAQYYGIPRNRDEAAERTKLIVDMVMQELRSTNHKLRKRLCGILRNRIIIPQNEVDELNIVVPPDPQYTPEVED